MISASMTATSYQLQHRDHRPLMILNRDDDSIMRFKSHIIAKRKSAVELLQETKPLYVKSEVVLDRKQELRRSLRVCYQTWNEDEQVTDGCANSTLSSRSSNNISPPPLTCTNYNAYNHNSSANNGTTAAPFPSPKSPRLIPPPPAFRKSTNSQQLQNKLRKLLNTDSKENLLETSSVIDEGDNSSASKISKIECNDSEFSIIGCYTSQFHSICHKSLPDLTNVRDLSSPIVSVSSDGICNKSTHADCVSLASCKNDYLYASADCCESQNDISFEDEEDVNNRPENLLPSSPVECCAGYITPPPLYCDNDEPSKNRPVSGSESDVGSRILSSIQTTDVPSYDSSNLNMFFDNLGLESNEYNSLTVRRSNASSPIYFDSDSSVISTGECVSDGDTLPTNHTGELPSIVERNARIIKWLCNCRKALEQIPRFVAPQFR